MKKLLDYVKLGLFAGALAIVGNSIVTSTAYANEAFCKGPGDSCHVIIGDNTHDFKALEA